MTSRMKTFLDQVDVEPEVKTVFFMMGYCHFCILKAELALKQALGTIFAVKDLEAEEKANEKAPFGHLLRKLRSRVDVDEDLEELINVFLKNRNLFVHHLTETIPFGTSDGLVDVANFCQILSIQARRIGSHFNAAIAAETPQQSFDGLDSEEVEELLPIVDLLFRRKEEPGQ